MKLKRSNLRGIGVDIVSRERIQKFIARHSDMVVRRFLNPAERKTFKKISTKEFAELFAAKEAFFKGCGEAWMGLEGFQNMRITKRAGDRFEMEWKSVRQPSSRKNTKAARSSYRGEGCFFHDGDLVGAQAIVWD